MAANLIEKRNIQRGDVGDYGFHLAIMQDKSIVSGILVNNESTMSDGVRKHITGVDKVRRVMRFLALGWHLEEIHMTWAHLEKKRTILRTYTKSLKESFSQSVETASQA
ncbi:hypothetical protein Tco_0534630 [Tanacetum coccineum]